MPTCSATGAATSRKPWTIRSPSATDPVQHDTTATKVSPTRSCGTNGSGGAIWNAGKPPYSRGASAMKSRKYGEQGRGVGQLEEHRTAVDVPDLVQPVGQLGGDAEVAAAAAQPPEQVGVLLLAGAHDRPVGRDDLCGQQVVAGQAVAPREVADPAAERQTSDAGGRDDAARRRQPVDGGRVVEATPRGAAAGAGGAGDRVDDHVAASATGRRRRRRRRCRSPGTLWPPPRTASGVPVCAAWRTTATTSSTPVHRTTAAGRASTMAL